MRFVRVLFCLVAGLLMSGVAIADEGHSPHTYEASVGPSMTWLDAGTIGFGGTIRLRRHYAVLSSEAGSVSIAFGGGGSWHYFGTNNLFGGHLGFLLMASNPRMYMGIGSELGFVAVTNSGVSVGFRYSALVGSYLFSDKVGQRLAVEVRHDRRRDLGMTSLALLIGFGGDKD